MSVCGAAWVYSPVYAHPPHANHACGLPLGHRPEDDGEIIHQCANCKCWANDHLIRAQAKYAEAK